MNKAIIRIESILSRDMTINEIVRHIQSKLENTIVTSPILELVLYNDAFPKELDKKGRPNMIFIKNTEEGPTSLDALNKDNIAILPYKESF